MKVLIFGATGRIGHHVVRRAALAGLEVTGFARTPGQTGRWIQGDVLDTSAVASAVAEFPVVVSTIGNPRSNPHGDRTVSRGTKNILHGMERAQGGRFISVSGFGAGDSRGQASWLFRCILASRLHDLYVDKELQEDAIRASSLDWLIVRPAHLLDEDPGRQARRIEGRGHLYERVSVDEVARFIMDELLNPRLHRTAISLGSESTS